MISCSVYGLGLRVNTFIAGLAGLPIPDHIDVNMTLGCLPPELAQLSPGDVEEYYLSPYRDERGQTTQEVFRLLEGRYFRINYSDGTVIVVDAAGANVWATWPDTATVEDTATYLLGPTLGFVLRLRGVTCLHASAVAIDNRAVALVGPSGAGKSSTAAAFAKLGYPVMSDDVVPLTDFGDRFDVRSAYPRVRLWPESVASLFGSVEALRRITPTWDKRFLDLNAPGYRFQQAPLSLAAIYLLGARSGAVEVPVVEAVRPGEGLIKLVAEAYGTKLLNMGQRAEEFAMLGRLVENVPVRRVTPGPDFNRITDLCNAIVDDFQQLTGGRAFKQAC